MTPRAMAQPMVNRWLSSILPPPDEIGCEVRWVDPATGVAKQDVVTQRALGLQPIDLLHIATLDGAAAMGELDDRIVAYVLDRHLPRVGCRSGHPPHDAARGSAEDVLRSRAAGA